jgi:ABC-type Fe3+-hydroxamate transport system substrate-binding protein
MIFTDQTGYSITLADRPRRIVSLVPSQTELLHDLGLDEEVIGITKFCIHPEKWFRSKTRVGGTKRVKINIIHSLQPDLIIANKEENTKADIKELRKHYPVWTSDISTVEEAFNMMREIGRITDTKEKANLIIEKCKYEFSQLQTENHKRPTAYFIWRNPWMSVGGGTFIHDMMERCGLENIFADLSRYPEIDIKTLIGSQLISDTEPSVVNCELILLSSEPYPFKEQHIAELREAGFKGKILLVDGEMFSWYGSRMLKAPAYLKDLLQDLS